MILIIKKFHSLNYIVFINYLFIFILIYQVFILINNNMLLYDCVYYFVFIILYNLFKLQ